jgi:purine-nucleoside phosphorylase
MLQKITEAAAFIQGQYSPQPAVGIVLGSGLGNFISAITVEKEIAYSDIPHFPVSTVQGHSGKLHFYEGYTAEEVVFPIRVMKLLGIETLFLSNAAGATNQSFKIGDLMLIKDHISFFQPNALIGKNEPALGPRFPDMSEAYNKGLLAKARAIAAAAGIEVKEGVYCGVTGPTFETRAEYRLLLAVGVDAVGMSTVQEVTAAAHMGIPVFAASVITDLAIFEGESSITHEEVLQAAKAAEPKLALIIKQLVAAL